MSTHKQVIPNAGLAERLSPVLPGWSEIPVLRSPLVIGLLPGEGIGPEVVKAAQSVLTEIQRHVPYAFEIRQAPATGPGLSGTLIDFFAQVFADGGAVLCGAKGGRFVYELRAHFDLYCKLVPVRPLVALRGVGVLRPEATAGVDLLLVRENTGGLYQGEYGFDQHRGRRRAFHHLHYDDVQVSRILQAAVGAALRRRQKLCVVTKPGGAPSISELWAEQAQRHVAGTPVELRFLEIDTAAYQILAEARAFDVVVAPNMFGDVLADAAALLLASRGLALSANLGAGGLGVYQTGHGAAYELAGSDRANPIGQIAALGLLLQESFGLTHLAMQIRAAIEDTLEAGWRTRDIAGPGSRLVGTQQMAERIAAALAARMAPLQIRTASERPVTVAQ